MDVYGAQTLGKQSDFYDMCINGVADIAYIFVPNLPGQFPITEGVALPFIGHTSATEASFVIQDFYDTTPEVQAEWSDVHVIFMHDHDPAPIGTVKKEVKVADDIKGLNLRVIGAPQIAMVNALGGGTIAIGAPELYTSLEKGVVDGYATGWEAIMSFKLPEVAKYVFDCNLYCGTFATVMNKDTWNSLSPEVQQVFNDIGGVHGAELFGNTWDNIVAFAKESAVADGVTINTPSQEELVKMQGIAKGIHDDYIKTVSDTGANGEAIYQHIKDLIKKYS